MKNLVLKKFNATSRTESLLVVVAAAVILFIRKTDSILNPQFWAEDGTVFFLDQYHHGASSIFQPCAGYFVTVQRIIALLADWIFPVFAAPYVYNYLSLIITLLVVASVYSPRLIMGNKALLAIAIVLVPHSTNEIFLNAANTQWILAFLIVMTLLKEPPHKKYGNIYVQVFCDFSVIIICGLTGPFIIFLIPFFAWRLMDEKSRYSFSLFLAALAPSLIQLSSIARHAYPQFPESNYDVIETLAAVVGQKFFGGLFLGASIPYKTNAFFLCFLLFCLFVVLAYFSADDKKRKFKIAVFLGFSMTLLLAAFYKFRLNLDTLVPSPNVRYFYIPYVMVVWSLIACMDLQAKWQSAVPKALLIMVLISSLTSGFRSHLFVDRDWRFYSELIGKEPNLKIPINPAGWEINMQRN